MKCDLKRGKKTSILNYFKCVPTECTGIEEGLPEPNGSLSKSVPSDAIERANAKVLKLKDTAPCGNRTGPYFRMGYMKRKACSKAKVDVAQFEQLKDDFFLKIKTITTMDEIPPELVINFDQTALNYVPISHWTMEKEGKKG